MSFMIRLTENRPSSIECPPFYVAGYFRGVRSAKALTSETFIHAPTCLLINYSILVINYGNWLCQDRL